MPHYQKQGEIPPKRHTQFRKEDGTLYAEELVSTEGFSDIFSIVYHEFPPTRILKIGKPVSLEKQIAVPDNMQHRLLSGFKISPEEDYLKSRKTVLFNDDVELILAAPKQSMTDYFFKNALADEMIFIHKGKGVMESVYGSLSFEKGDQIVIPRGTVYQLKFENGDNRLFIVESYHPIRFPKRYKNDDGQLLEHAPFYERDIKAPVLKEHFNKEGEFLVKIKRKDTLFPYVYANHPFDAVGWDGCLYPFIFSIYDFDPITGKIHQPPPVHQVFETAGFVVCNFVPRLFDYHPLSIPAPYNHSNVDSDEVIYYVDGDFMSRNNIGKGQITLHPMGIPHGPQPGAVERSIGKQETEEYAVMVDTFRPLKITREAMDIEEPGYYKSWIS
ncbi:MAG: homogentisate 1,2-dioxygenase [Bacteroidales bacterium]|nr:homogentisate 1,2-dioxygenase [Bacteroidales bacterium]